MASSPEVFLISSILRNQDYQNALAAGLTSEMFKACSDEWDWLTNYTTRYRKTPSKAAFLRQFPDFRLKIVDDTKHFTDEVRKAHARRMLTSSMSDCTGFIADGDIESALKLMRDSVISVASNMGGVEDVDLVRDWETIYNDVAFRKEQFDKHGLAGIPTGIDVVDAMTGGVGIGQSWIVAARLGEYKSWTLMRMAVAALMAGKKVHFSALEMSRAEVGMRFHNMLSGQIGQRVFRSVDLAQGTNFDLVAYKKWVRELKNEIKGGQLTISDSRGIGITDIAAQVERHKPDVYFLDYLTLANTGGDGGWQDIGKFSKGIKTVAGDYGVGMVSAAQLNRNATLNKGPAGAEDLARADEIGQDADAVITQKKRSERVFESRMAKYRHGRSGFGWWSHLDLDRGIFMEVDKQKALDLIDQDKDRADKIMEDASKITVRNAKVISRRSMSPTGGTKRLVKP